MSTSKTKLEHFLDSQNKFLTELLERTSKKQIEYSRHQDPFHNFKKAAQLSLTENEVAVAWEFCVKHLQSLKDLILDYNNEVEISKDIVDEKIGDIIIYMTLIRGMLLQNQRNDVKKNRN